MNSTENSMFIGKDVTFDDIIYKGKLGGKSAITTYLDIRIKQLTRGLTLYEEGGPTSKRLLLGIAAMRNAQQLLGTLS
jgi:hypothetical protein